MKRVDFHCHTDKSNFSSRDSINKETTLIDRALELGLNGVAITDHGVLSAHMKALLYLDKLKKEAKEGDPVKDFRLILGSEIYLVDRETVDNARKEFIPTKFYHLVVIAKNYEGYRALCELSSKSWIEGFNYRGVQRVPTYKDYFFEWAKQNKGNIMVTTACLGSEFAELVLNFSKEGSHSNRNKIIEFVNEMILLFDEDFYIEIQPSHFEEQIIYNKLAIQIANDLGVKVLINTDCHYPSLELREVHSIYLKSQQVERETEQFYSSTYLMSCEELKEYFEYLDNDTFKKFMDNSIVAANRIEEFSLLRDTEIPKGHVSIDETRASILAPLVLNNIEKYNYIYNYGTSEFVEDRILLQQMEIGLIDKEIDITEQVLERINRELRSLWLISEKLNQRLSNYYLLTKEIVEIIWQVSLLDPARGSAGSFFICYLLDITSINPLDYNLDDWRHISYERPELPDIDIDSEAGQRENILNLIKERFGYYNVVNICTFKTEGTASAIQTMCRGMSIPIEESTYLSSLVVDGKSIKKSLEDYNTDRECKLLIDEMLRYEKLVENVIAIEGLVCGKSIHASGVYISNTPIWKWNALMKAPNGQEISQFDMMDSDLRGGLKVDLLTIEALDKIRKCLDLLIEDGIIEKQENLKKTYNKYLHPDILNLDDPKMWQYLCDNEILDVFQYDSAQGRNAIVKIQPDNFRELCDGNALMRLTCPGEQPIDKYVKHKNNISLWYDEMRNFGLNEDEIKVMEKHLLKSYGVAATQEAVMRLSMDNSIANFDLVWANKLRKAIAKAKAKNMIEEVKDEFMRSGLHNSNRFEILNYVWERCIVPQLNYSFSEPHLSAYTLVAIQEMNLYKLSPLHWKVACLCVDSGDINDNKSKNTDYGAISKAICDMEKGFVLTPDINNSDVGFKPYMEKNRALYGLGAINGISNDLAKEIIRLRPFTSFEDFIIKAVATKIVKPSKVYNLIKSGCFDEFNNNRRQIMFEFINYLIPDKTSLTIANINKLLEYGIIDKTFERNILLYNLRKLIFIEKNCIFKFNKTHGLYVIPVNIAKLFEDNFLNEFMDCIEYDVDGRLSIKSKEFKKKYDEIQKELITFIKSQETLKKYNNAIKMQTWNKYCEGSIAKWEMDSICYYSKTHELEEIKLDNYYKIDNFKELSEIPEQKITTDPRTLRTRKEYKTYTIAGVVVEKNKSKSIVTLSTTTGIVEVKLYRELFAKYDKKTEVDSWFERGTKLIVIGFRRGEVFVPRISKTSIFNSSILKIDIRNNIPMLVDKDDFTKNYKILQQF